MRAKAEVLAAVALTTVFVASCSGAVIVSGVLVTESGAHATECRLRLMEEDFEHWSVEVSGEFEEELITVGIAGELRVEIRCEASSFVYKCDLSREYETDRTGVYDLGTIVMK